MTHRVVFSPEAQADLLDLYDSIAAKAGHGRALAYVERLAATSTGFATFPQRGTKRDDVPPGLRVVGFEHCVAIAFHVDADQVTIDPVLYGGRDIDGAFREG